MASIQVQAGEVNSKHVSAEVQVDDGRNIRGYYLFVTTTYVTVVVLPATRRSLGKTFHTNDDLVANYKRDGLKLLEIVGEMRKMIEDAANLSR